MAVGAEEELWGLDSIFSIIYSRNNSHLLSLSWIFFICVCEQTCEVSDRSVSFISRPNWTPVSNDWGPVSGGEDWEGDTAYPLGRRPTTRFYLRCDWWMEILYSERSFWSLLCCFQCMSVCHGVAPVAT